jgi:dihydroorotate dehydrogenase
MEIQASTYVNETLGTNSFLVSEYYMASLRLATSRRFLEIPHRKGSLPSRSIFGSSKSAPPRSPILTGFYRTVFVLSTGLFAVYYFDARSAIHRYFLTPVLRYALDAETGHKVAVKVLRSGLGPRDPVPDDEKLKFEVRVMKILVIR